MTQQINLYSLQFRPVRDALPGVRVVGLSVAAVLMLGAAWGWTSWRIAEARSGAAAISSQLASRQAEIAGLTKTAGARRTDPKLEQELARAESLHRSRTELMGLIDSGALGAPGGFSEQMRALARQSAAGLWLTGFTLASGQVELRGRALNAELVPAYLRRLGQEKVMAGVSFNALRIAQPAPEKSATALDPSKAASSAGAAARGPAFIEFQVASDARAILEPVRP